MIELPKEEYIHVKENGKTVTYCILRQKAMHVIGLDGQARPYTRHGKRFYKPYRNYFSAPKAGDRDLDMLEEAGYMEREITHPGTDREGVWYSYNRAGLDWLGGQLGIKIYDAE